MSFFQPFSFPGSALSADVLHCYSRRWIIIATPEEIATLSAAPGVRLLFTPSFSVFAALTFDLSQVSVWTLEEAEERLKSPLPEIIG